MIIGFIRANENPDRLVRDGPGGKSNCYAGNRLV